MILHNVYISWRSLFFSWQSSSTSNKWQKIGCPYGYPVSYFLWNIVKEQRHNPCIICLNWQKSDFNDGVCPHGFNVRIFSSLLHNRSCQVIFLHSGFWYWGVVPIWIQGSFLTHGLLCNSNARKSYLAI